MIATRRGMRRVMNAPDGRTMAAQIAVGAPSRRATTGAIAGRRTTAVSGIARATKSPHGSATRTPNAAAARTSSATSANAAGAAGIETAIMTAATDATGTAI